MEEDTKTNTSKNSHDVGLLPTIDDIPRANGTENQPGEYQYGIHLQGLISLQMIVF